MIKKAALLAFCLAVSSSASAGFISFTSSGTFIVPDEVNSIRVLTVGGGGGGANGHQGGGGSGYINSGVFAVNAGEQLSVAVGLGGSGALANSSNTIVGLTAGGSSELGSLISSLGGGVVSGLNQSAGNGGSGGGGSYNGGAASGTPGGAGGSGGSNGQNARYLGGTGQGDYSNLLAIFTENIFTPGAGGIGGLFDGIWNGGGGAGGILMNGLGIEAGSGSETLSGQGGVGFGAGGGAGGYSGISPFTRYAGGDGAAGLVYIEFDSVEVSAPTGLGLLLLGTGLLLRVRKKEA